jgi:hypothetical protein
MDAGRTIFTLLRTQVYANSGNRLLVLFATNTACFLVHAIPSDIEVAETVGASLFSLCQTSFCELDGIGQYLRLSCYILFLLM